MKDHSNNLLHYHINKCQFCCSWSLNDKTGLRQKVHSLYNSLCISPCKHFVVGPSLSITRSDFFFFFAWVGLFIVKIDVPTMNVVIEIHWKRYHSTVWLTDLLMKGWCSSDAMMALSNRKEVCHLKDAQLNVEWQNLYLSFKKI